MLQVIKCPSRAPAKHSVTVFLAGSIEMNSAENWQKFLEEHFATYPATFFNPRRDDWKSDWKQTLEDANFVEQVEWELEMLERCDFIFMHFDPATKSPISLLEFGMYAKSDPKKLIVSCPEGFWRKGNVQVTSKRYGNALFDDIFSATRHLYDKMEQRTREKRVFSNR